MLVAGGESVPENDGIIRRELSIGVLATSHKNVEENIGKGTSSNKDLSVLDDFTSFRPASSHQETSQKIICPIFWLQRLGGLHFNGS